jgi:Zn-finger nucleic acid-binding protein
MKCPACHKELRQSDFREYGSVVVDVCSSCNGAWFDKGELDRFDDSVWVNAERIALEKVPSDHKNASCPKCGVDLEALCPPDAPELVLDRCPKCEGFWLDAGELEKVQDVAAATHSEMARGMKHYTRPPSWSRLRWAIYTLKEFGGI